ncbi:MAG: amidase [Paracoccaceae bacterium]
MSDVLMMGLREVADLLRASRIGAQELLGEVVAAIGRHDHICNAVLAIETERAFAEAAALDRLPKEARGPLHGVPLAHKDMYYRAGEVTTCGAGFRRDTRMGSTAELLQRLDAAGAISFARLNMAEYAMGPTGHNRSFGRCCNPFAPDRISGGSSSGSGAAVAARFAYGALGSDTGGSVRLPAALCGVVGLKPTQGLLSLEGVMGLSESLDCPGPMARSSGDIARLMDVMCGTAHHERGLEAGVRGLRIGIPQSYYVEDLASEVAASFDAAIGVLRDLGCDIRQVDLPDHGPYADLADAIWKPEAAALHLRTLQTDPERLAPQARARLMQGLATSAVDYVRAHQLRSLALRAMLDGPLHACDIILTPALRIPAPRAVDVEEANGDAMRRNLEAITAFTRPLNFLGLPGLVTPCGLDEAGVPMAIQMIGAPRQEALLLRAGHAFESAAGFNRMRPSFLQ